MSASLRPAASDGIEVVEVIRTIRRGWRAVATCTALGVALAVAVLLFAPRLYEGNASVLVRASSDGGAGLLSRLGNVGDLLGSAGGGALRSPLETEIQVLTSRSLAGAVMDSLRLQARVMSPRGTSAASLVQSMSLAGPFAPADYEFERTAPGRYRVRTGDFTGELVAGQSGPVPHGTLTLAVGPELESFGLRMYDREEAISRLQSRLSIGKAGGDVARVIYRGGDRATAAAVPNLLLGLYLERRKTVDRGTNQKRVEFLTSQVDSTASELAATERALRVQQEKSGVLDAVVVGRVEIEQAALLRKTLIEVEVEEGAITQLLQQATSGTISGRTLAAYPAFLRGASLNSLVSQLGELETARLKLLERRTEQDPEVVALSQSIAAMEGQFIPMARAYASALGRQRADIRTQLDSMQRSILAIPAAAETGGRLQRDVIRMSQIYSALQAQLVQARLSAIDEGGDVRQLDVAVPPRRAWFPKTVVTMGLGFGGGLIAGLVAALALSLFGRWVRDPGEIERATGVPAQRLGTGAPLFMTVAEPATSRTLLIIPLDDRARVAGSVVAERLARAATNRSVTATVLDLSTDALRRAASNGNGETPGAGVASIIEDLERRFGMVVVQLPGMSSDATAAALREGRPVLLVAPADRVNRAQLMSAVETLRRLRVPCAGIVIGDATATA